MQEISLGPGRGAYNCIDLRSARMAELYSRPIPGGAATPRRFLLEQIMQSDRVLSKLAAVVARADRDYARPGGSLNPDAHG
jgi:hypothetical protein